MNEMKVGVWRLSGNTVVPGEDGGATMLSFDLANYPDLVDQIVDWQPVSHQITPMGDGDLLLTVLLRRKVEAPESPQAL